MTKAFASSYSQQSTIDFRALSNAQAGDWVTLANHQNLVWARFVSELGGHCFDPAFERSNASYGYISSSNSRNISEVSVAGIAERKIDVSGTDSVRVGLAIFGDNIDVQLTLTDKGDGIALPSIEASTSTSQTEWALATGNFTYSQVTDGSGNPNLLVGDLQAKSGDGTTGSLYEVRVGEVEITSTSEIPSS